MSENARARAEWAASWWLWLVAVAITGGAVAFVVVQLSELRDFSPAVAQTAALRPEILRVAAAADQSAASGDGAPLEAAITALEDRRAAISTAVAEVLGVEAARSAVDGLDAALADLVEAARSYAAGTAEVGAGGEAFTDATAHVDALVSRLAAASLSRTSAVRARALAGVVVLALAAASPSAGLWYMRRRFGALHRREAALAQLPDELTADLPVMLYQAEPDGELVVVSGSSSMLLGRTRGALAGRLLSDFAQEILAFAAHVPPGDADEALSDIASFGADWRHADGTLRRLHTVARAVRDPDERLVAIRRIVRDLSEQQAAERALRESEKRFRTVLETAQNGIMVVNPEGAIELTNGALRELLGYSAEELHGRPVRDLVHLGASDRIVELLAAPLWSGEPRSRRQERFVRKDDSVFDADLSVSPFRERGRGGRGARRGARHHREQARRRDDPAPRVRRRADGPAEPFGVQPRAGGGAGRRASAQRDPGRDAVRPRPVQADQRHARAPRGRPRAARGGRTAAAAAAGPAHAGAPGGRRVHAAGQGQPAGGGGRRSGRDPRGARGAVRVRGAGAARGGEHRGERVPGRRRRRRDADLARGQRDVPGEVAGAQQPPELQPGDGAGRAGPLQPPQRPAAGAQREGIRPALQPLVDARHGRILGAEALVRWAHPERGLVHPEEFAPILEDTGLIIPVGEWVIRLACAQAKRWQEAGLAGSRVAVNLSARQVLQPDLTAIIERSLAEHRLAPERLTFELTETVAMQNMDAAVRVLSELRELGVEVTLDDFGSGRSALSHLKRLPLQGVKIDRSFVGDVTANEGACTIVTGVVALSRALNLSTAAVGVETESQRRFLHSLDCDVLQGFLFGRPLPAAQFEALLRDQAAAERAA